MNPIMPAEKSSTSAPRTTFVIASRASKLAQIQTNSVRDALDAAFPHLSFQTSFQTNEAGDKDKVQALYLLGGKSLWTKELEVALLDGSVDMLVHSLKDMPTVLPEGCALGAVAKRESPLDTLVVKAGQPWKSLDDLPDGSVVGTSSIRRVAQLRRSYPKIQIVDVRGNIDSRLAKLDAPDGPYVALILAKAGLMRMGLGARATCDLTAPTFLHAVSQGALGIEVRADDTEALQLCAALTHSESDLACRAERACLRVLEGGCTVPVGVVGEMDGNVLKLNGAVTSVDGSRHVQHELVQRVVDVKDAEALGEQLARTLIATGGRAILEEIIKDRAERTKDAELKTATEVGKVEDAMQASA